MTNQHTERTLNKVDVAKTQLDAAIQAYGRGEDVVAVTLAGAAEEIFGAMCFRQNIKNAVEKIAELSHLSVISDNPKKRITYLNDVRNCLKHAKELNEDFFVGFGLKSFLKDWISLIASFNPFSFLDIPHLFHMILPSFL